MMDLFIVRIEGKKSPFNGLIVVEIAKILTTFLVRSHFFSFFSASALIDSVSAVRQELSAPTWAKPTVSDFAAGVDGVDPPDGPGEGSVSASGLQPPASDMRPATATAPN